MTPTHITLFVMFVVALAISIASIVLATDTRRTLHALATVLVYPAAAAGANVHEFDSAAASGGVHDYYNALACNCSSESPGNGSQSSDTWCNIACGFVSGV